jgi:hypothetical protein
MHKTLLVVGSKAEFYRYGVELIEITGHSTSKLVWVREPHSLFGTDRPIVYVAGTGHLIPQFGDILVNAKSRNGVIKYIDIPGLVIMPTLEIAHEFADRLGLDPSWRFSSEK